MTATEPNQRHWLLVFGATLAILIGVAIWLSLRIPSFLDPAFNFYAMKPNDIFNVYGLTRRQEGSVKLGFAEAYPAPEIGLYGNHIAAFFGADAFGRPQDAEYFFNYFYANLSLPEIHRYLQRVEQAGHLPKKLILIQITPPNADTGSHAKALRYASSVEPPSPTPQGLVCLMMAQTVSSNSYASCQAASAST